MTCPECVTDFIDPKFKFCPYDGAELVDYEDEDEEGKEEEEEDTIETK